MEPVLAREREARFNVEHRPKVFRSSPSMIKTFEANPNTSCGLRPRLRRDLDHAERQEENTVFTLLLALSILQLAVCSLDGAVWSVHLALWALELIIKTLQARRSRPTKPMRERVDQTRAEQNLSEKIRSNTRVDTQKNPNQARTCREGTGEKRLEQYIPKVPNQNKPARTDQTKLKRRT